MANSNQNLVENAADAKEARRKLLLEKYLKGEIKAAQTPVSIPRRAPGPLPSLSFAQQQVWLHAQLAPDIPIYNEPMTITRTGPLDLAVVERCMLEIIRRHEIWRTTFDTVDGQPVQIVHSAPASLAIPFVDLRALPATQRDIEARRLIAEEATRTLDLKRGPLVRMLVLQLEVEHFELFFNIHQIVLDGATAYRGLLRELSSLYEAFSAGKPSPLPEPSIQYADYAIWHRDWVANGKEVARQMEYWEKKLAGDLPVLQWPSDRPRPAVQTFAGKVKSLTLPKSFAQKLKDFSQHEGVTLYMTLLAGFVTLMHRYTGQEDVTVGTVSAGRKWRETEAILGYFLNPVPLRTDVSGDPDFRQLLARVRQTASGALSNDDVPFEQLVKRFQKVRDSSRNPLFNVVVSLEPAMPSVGDGWNMVLGDTPTGASKLDLYVNFDDRADGLMATLTYNPDLFEDETITRLITHWQTVLENAAANPAQKVSTLPLMTQAEQHKLLVEWNATEHAYPQRSLHELFEEQAAKTPETVALEFSGLRLTYSELNRRANQLAHSLRKNGIGPQSLVGVYVERSFDTVVALLGVLKADAAWVPIDPVYPQARVEMMLQDAKIAVVLTQAKLAANLAQGEVKVVCLDSDWNSIAKESAANPAHTSTLDDVAYAIYTSGSTGKPKGVRGTHRGAINRFSWMWQKYPFAADEVCCQKTSLGFVDSIWEIFGPLLAGVKTVLVPDEVLKNTPELIECLAKNKVSRLVLVPSLMRTMLETFPDLQRRLPRLKFWITSGEAIPVELAQKFSASIPQATLLNLYGSSEVAADSTYYEVEKNSALSCVPIGKPIANTQVYILDRNLQPVPLHVPGELYVGGDGLARGYLNRPELTAERFIADRFSKNPAARLYKTGDLARYLADGNIEYLGRGDNQVKIRGFRIELGEIESVLSEAPGVKQGVILARADASGSKQLAAYVVATAGQTLEQREIQAYLRQRLPDYMVPSAVVFMDALPLLPNGKIDRLALPAPGQIARNDKDKVEAVPPSTDMQRQMLAIWEEVLGVQKIGIQDDFFELGGHSLLIPILLSRIEREFSKKLSPAAIFQAPTIEQFAELVSRQSAELVQVMPIQPAGSKPPFFCICLAEGPLLRDLGIALGEDQPFLGLGFDPSELDQLATPYTLEDIASHLVNAIRAQQPEGPYYLGGFCLNGLIAFETARQLTVLGERVALLALFEAVNPAHHDSFSQRSQLAHLLGRFEPGLVKHHVSSLWNVGASGIKDYFSTRFSDIRRETRNLFWSTYVEIRRMLLGDRLPRLQQILYVTARAYHPVPYTCASAFYRCTDRRANSSSELERGWSGLLTGDFELHVLEGDHMGILVGKSLQVLASKLTASLAKASAESELKAKETVLVTENSAAVFADPFCGIRS